MIFTQLQQINTAHSLAGETLFVIIEKQMVFLQKAVKQQLLQTTQFSCPIRSRHEPPINSLN